MGIAQTPSAITLPPADPPYPSILEFLVRTFPHVARERWEARLRAGRVRDANGRPITAATPYIPAARLVYFREVEIEPAIPFTEHIVYQDDEILVACKPHFLPVVPGGRYVNECLEQRLRARTGLGGLVPLHRIDRETAGLVMFSVNPATRGHYHELFARRRVHKTYYALAVLGAPPRGDRWVVENRLVRGEPRFRMQAVVGTPNARSIIRLVETHGRYARFELEPVTGKTHQLRVHLSGLGFPIVNDRYYPELEAERADDFARPLQLLAAGLQFRDPLTGRAREFHATRWLPGLDAI
jgi:tRNA pseudouridine32 synthase/23S rRNA pseudouridine746 synthase